MCAPYSDQENVQDPIRFRKDETSKTIWASDYEIAKNVADTAEALISLVCFLRDSEIKDLQKNEKRMRTVDIDHVLDAKPLEANNNTNLHANASYLIAQSNVFDAI